MDFWKRIDKALDTIAETKPDTFDGVRDILHQHGDPDGISSQGDDKAFFAGSGGDKPLRVSLNAAGWRTVWSEANYYYVMAHPKTGELLSYIEGDVERGVNGVEPHLALMDQINNDGLKYTHAPNGKLLTVSL